jgi:hypothetical protein
MTAHSDAELTLKQKAGRWVGRLDYPPDGLCGDPPLPSSARHNSGKIDSLTL